MTVALVISQSGLGASALDPAWVSLFADSGESTFVLAPAHFDTERLEHVAAGPDELDMLKAFSDLARFVDDDLLFIDATTVRPDSDGARLVTDAQARVTSAPRVGVIRVDAADRADAARIWQQLAAGGGAESDTDDTFDRARLAWLAAQASSALPTSGVKKGDDHDGPYAARVIRPVGRLLAERAVRADVSPVSLTVLALAAGVATAVVAAAGSWVAVALAWVLAHLCVAGFMATAAVAEVTDRAAPFWRWLHGVLAAVAALVIGGGLAQGSDFVGVDAWGMTAVAAALLGGAWLLQSAAATALAAGDGSPELTVSVDHAPWWVTPGGELILLVGAVTLAFDGLVGARVAAAWGAAALLSVVIRSGRKVRRRHVVSPRALRTSQSRLLQQADPGPLALLVGRQDPEWSTIRRLAATGAAWLIPTALLAIESIVLLVLVSERVPEALSVAYLVVSVVLLHRVETVWRQRTADSAAAPWAFAVGLGALGRTITYVVLAAAGRLLWGLGVLAVVWATTFSADAASDWAERTRSQSSS